MAYTAKAKYLRVSSKKIERYLNMVRGLDADEAQAVLGAVKNASATSVAKVIHSAAAQGSGALVVKKIYTTPGPALKRMRPGAFGRAHLYKRRMSHINVELDAPSASGNRKRGK